MNISILLADPRTLRVDSTVITGEEVLVIVRTVSPMLSVPSVTKRQLVCTVAMYAL